MKITKQQIICDKAKISSGAFRYHESRNIQIFDRWMENIWMLV